MKKKIEIIKDNPIGLKKGEVKNLDVNVANSLIKANQAKIYKEKQSKTD